MGYSYAARAGYTLDSIGKLINVKTSNGMPDGGFYETGREQADGAITGTVWKPIPGSTHVTKRGSFRIDPNGKVARFPGLSRALIKQAEEMGEAEYHRRHGPRVAPDWRVDGARLRKFLADEPKCTFDCWDDFQAVHRGWQSEAKVMFAVMPNVTAAEMIASLDDMLTLKTLVA